MYLAVDCRVPVNVLFCDCYGFQNAQTPHQLVEFWLVEGLLLAFPVHGKGTAFTLSDQCIIFSETKLSSRKPVVSGRTVPL